MWKKILVEKVGKCCRLREVKIQSISFILEWATHKYNHQMRIMNKFFFPVLRPFEAIYEKIYNPTLKRAKNFVTIQLNYLIVGPAIFLFIDNRSLTVENI